MTSLITRLDEVISGMTPCDFMVCGLILLPTTQEKTRQFVDKKHCPIKSLLEISSVGYQPKSPSTWYKMSSSNSHLLTPIHKQPCLSILECPSAPCSRKPTLLYDNNTCSFTLPFIFDDDWTAKMSGVGMMLKPRPAYKRSSFGSLLTQPMKPW